MRDRYYAIAGRVRVCEFKTKQENIMITGNSTFESYLVGGKKVSLKNEHFLSALQENITLTRFGKLLKKKDRFEFLALFDTFSAAEMYLENAEPIKRVSDADFFAIDYERPIYEISLLCDKEQLQPGNSTVQYKLKNNVSSYIAHKAWLPYSYKNKEFLLQQAPKTYNKITESSDNCENNEVINKIANLLHDYHQPKHGLFLTLHWNRHHPKLAQTIEAGLKDKSIQEAYEYLKTERVKALGSDKANYKGSLIRRLDFAIEHLQQALTPKKTATLTVV